MAKTLKTKVNPKRIWKPLASTACKVISPAANLLGS